MKFTAAERTGLTVIGVIIVAVSVAMAIFSHAGRGNRELQISAPCVVDSLISEVEATDTVVAKPHKPKPAPAPVRNHLDETF